VALLLKEKGIKRVRPLAGGLDAWIGMNLPVHPPVLVTIETGR
jgi:rhodanese-related sulfurtransferase